MFVKRNNFFKKQNVYNKNEDFFSINYPLYSANVVNSQTDTDRKQFLSEIHFYYIQPQVMKYNST